MAWLVLSRANVRRVLVKLTAALDCGIDGCRATGPSHWTSNSNINRLSSHVFDIGRPFSDGRPRGPLWRSRKVVGKEALVVIQELKRIKDDSKRLESFMKTNIARLLKADLLAVLAELQRQDEVFLALKIYKAVKQEVWYKPDKFLFKDMIIVMARNKKMDEAMQLWEEMKKEKVEPDIQTYSEVIRGFLKYGSPSDAMNIYEEMKESPEPPEELPFRVLLKGLLPHPLLRNKVKQDFQEIFPDRHIYDPPEELFGMQWYYVSKGRERYRDCSLCLMKHFIFMEGVPVRKKCWVLAAGSSFIFQLRDFVSCVCTKDVRK